MLPTPTSKDAKSQRELRQELITVKRELNATSSQDQFAKWAKLRRQHDKKQAEYDEKSERLLIAILGELEELWAIIYISR